jgi:acetyl esterase/lipase
MIHGGGWFAGDKSDGYTKPIREDFTKRGYTTVSVNYKMGLFHSD